MLDTHFEYEVAISFAGEQRPAAEAIAKLLEEAGVTVFYDKDEKAELWGKDLYVHLFEVYQRKAQYCILLSSREYVQNVWTNHERQSAQARALSEKGKDYILPVRMDDTEIPGLAPSVAFLDYRYEGAAGVAHAFLSKTRNRLANELARPIKTQLAKPKGLVGVEEGPIIRVMIEGPRVPEASLGLRAPGLEINALIDIGASVTIVNPEVARTCGLRMTGKAVISAPGHVDEYPEYAATISFPGTSLRKLTSLRVLAVPIRGASYACLLGRNALQDWKITYDGRTGEIEIEE